MKIGGCAIIARIKERLGDSTGLKALIVDLGYKTSTVYSWSENDSVPKSVDLLKIADYLGVSMRWLLTGEDESGLAPDERGLLDSYRRLDDRDRQDVVGIIAVKLSRYEQSYEQGEKGEWAAG
ncbi:MAG: helix-turn-helix domain containing protein [Treponema sp.]|jgi:transcriptional regulator with XRE-family HTH domain|nr:helix-turn-helix domain containing protein [Treponema sp.]